MQTYEAIVVGGGPAGATAAADLARAGRSVLLIDKPGRVKPCGGAIPPRAMDEFAIPRSALCAEVACARVVAPSGRSVDIPVAAYGERQGGEFVGMVDRAAFDPWLRARAAAAGAAVVAGSFEGFERHGPGIAVRWATAEGEERTAWARALIGADGARSKVAKQALPDQPRPPSVFAYHEIVEAPDGLPPEVYDPARCDVVYDGRVSPDFYGWVFPHGATASVGVGSAVKGFSLRGATAGLRARAGLGHARTVRREGAPLPLEPMKRWDDGANVVLAGDAAGVVAPSSGEGIFYAMTCGREAATSAGAFLKSGEAAELARARKRFVRTHGGVFWILGAMQRYWYTNDERRERFVSICQDLDVQKLTFDAYMNKELVRARPLAHLRILAKNLAHLGGFVPAWK